jgi:hypothetical protein
MRVRLASFDYGERCGNLCKAGTFEITNYCILQMLMWVQAAKSR